MFGIDYCDVKMKSRYQLKFSESTLHAVTAEVIELKNRKKSQKDVVYFQPEDNYET